MGKSGLALLAFATVALVGCGERKKEAVGNLQNETEQAASNMTQLAAEIPNSDQANVAANVAEDLTNAEQALQNVEHKKK